MKPPRLPGTEKFRFCDKKYEQQQITKCDPLECDDVDHDHKSITSTERLSSSTNLIRKDSFLYVPSSLHNRSISNESILYDDEKNISTNDDNTNVRLSSGSSSSSSCTLEELINHVNRLSMQPTTMRLEHSSLTAPTIVNKRKPNLPISSRMTSRVFTLTNIISHLNEHESNVNRYGRNHRFYREKKPKRTQSVVYGDEKVSIGTRSFHDQGFESSSSRSSTPNSLDSSLESGTLPSDLSDEANLRLHPPMIALTTSHASLMSDDQSSTSSSCSSAQPNNEFNHSLRSFSCSPIEHWAKQTSNNKKNNAHNRLSTSSHSSWEDDSVLNEVT